MAGQNFNSKKFKEKFIEIYGKTIWKKVFLKTHKTKQAVKDRFTEIPGKIKGLTSFYTNDNNKQYTRFILITLEKYYGICSIDFSDGDKWPIEHLYPQTNYDDWKNKLGNLTLISQKLNTDTDNYKDKSFADKSRYIISKQNSYAEYYFFINKINDNSNQISLFSQDDLDVDKRTQYLKEKFSDIFNTPENLELFLLKVFNIK